MRTCPLLNLVNALPMVFSLAVTTALGAAETDSISANQGPIRIRPINHASLALEWNGKTIYVDPVGPVSRFEGLPKPDLVLITDIHGDHLNKEALAAVVGSKTTIVAPAAVGEQLSTGQRERTITLGNGQPKEVEGLSIEAIAAYNTSPEREKFHPKGRGNGYVVTLGGKRVYISGDTEGTPEMKGLKNIDLAFMCMNLPYTMDVKQAAEAVRAFRPRIVYPYHYRGSDLEEFKRLLADSGIEVRLRDWYGKG